MSKDLRRLHLIIGVSLLLMLALGWGSHRTTRVAKHASVAPRLAASADRAGSPPRP